KQYQVELEPNKLVAYGVATDEVMKAVRRSNEDVGVRVIEIAGHEHVIRGRGYIKKKEDLELIPVKVGSGGIPIYVRDIRRGLAELDGQGEVVGGIVIMRYGENALDVIDGVKARLAEVERSLPEG